MPLDCLRFVFETSPLNQMDDTETSGGVLSALGFLLAVSSNEVEDPFNNAPPFDGLAVLFDISCEESTPALQKLRTLVQAASCCDRPDSAESTSIEKFADEYFQQYSLHVDFDEQVPQRTNSNPDPLLNYWKNRSLMLAEECQEGQPRPSSTRSLPKIDFAKPPRATESSEQRRNDGRTVGSLRPNSRTLSPLLHAPKESANLACKAIAASRAKECACRDLSFWTNRVKMLHREVEKAQAQVDQRRSQSHRFEVSTILNETVSSQLQEERKREVMLRQEKADAIRLHRQSHRDAVRKAQSQIIHAKIEVGKVLRVHAENHKAIVNSMKQDEFEKKCQKRSRIQQEKVVAMLKRVREAGLHKEEVKRRYEMHIQHVLEEKDEEEEQTIQCIEESSKLLQKMRRLKELQFAAGLNENALRSLTASQGLYSTRNVVEESPTPRENDRSIS